MGNKLTKEQILAIYNRSETDGSLPALDPPGSEYFAPYETKCRCGCGLDIKAETKCKANLIRRLHGVAIGVSSGARCEAYNVKIGGAKKSRHIQGRAVDFVWTQELQNFLEKNCETLEYSLEDPHATPGWLHVDLDKRNGKFGIFKP